MQGLLWLMRQYTDLLRDVNRSKEVTEDHEAEQVMRSAGCGQLQLWVAKSSRTIMIGELRLQTIKRCHSCKYFHGQIIFNISWTHFLLLLGLFV